MKTNSKRHAMVFNKDVIVELNDEKMKAVNSGGISSTFIGTTSLITITPILPIIATTGITYE